MKIRGSALGTNQKPERVLEKAGGAKSYYSTEREEIGESHGNISAEYIWGLYDALMAEYDGKVQKNEIHNDDGTFVNYEYVISTGDSYSDDGGYELRDGDDGIKKPKYLVMSGIDGNERLNVFSTYRFVRDVLRGHNVPQSFKEGVILHVLPVASPWAFSTLDTSTKVNDSYLSHRFNQNKVYLEHNFNCEWVYKESGEYVESVEDENSLYKKDAKGNFVKYTKTTTENGKTEYVKDTNGKYFKKLKSLSTVDSVNEKYVAEKETQAITNWLNANADADLFISYHNSGGLFEIAVILGDSSNYETDMAKKIALRGVSRVIPFWKNVIGYPSVFKDVLYVYLDEDGNGKQGRGDRETIFSYSANTRIKGSSILYAQEKLGIPSFIIETPVYYGTYGEFEANEPVYQPEPIAAGAEALGNILIEHYEQSLLSGVTDEMNSKLDQILQGVSFRVVKGSFTPSENISDFATTDIPAGAKMIEIILQGEKPIPYANSLLTVHYALATEALQNNAQTFAGRGTFVDYYTTSSGGYKRDMLIADTTNGFAVTLPSASGMTVVFAAGKTYEWTAYYWDE